MDRLERFVFLNNLRAMKIGLTFLKYDMANFCSIRYVLFEWSIFYPFKFSNLIGYRLVITHQSRILNWIFALRYAALIYTILIRLVLSNNLNWFLAIWTLILIRFIDYDNVTCYDIIPTLGHFEWLQVSQIFVLGSEAPVLALDLLGVFYDRPCQASLGDTASWMYLLIRVIRRWLLTPFYFEWFVLSFELLQVIQALLWNFEKWGIIRIVYVLKRRGRGSQFRKNCSWVWLHMLRPQDKLVSLLHPPAREHQRRFIKMSFLNQKRPRLVLSYTVRINLLH